MDHFRFNLALEELPSPSAKEPKEKSEMIHSKFKVNAHFAEHKFDEYV